MGVWASALQSGSNPPAVHLQHFSSGLHRRRRFGKMPLFFIIPPAPSLFCLIHISWRALEVWNCLKLIHYWIFSPRLKSLASLPHNSVPIDCLGPNISQGCTEQFSRDFLKLYQHVSSALTSCKWCHPRWAFVKLLQLSTALRLFRFTVSARSKLLLLKSHICTPTVCHSLKRIQANLSTNVNNPQWSN